MSALPNKYVPISHSLVGVAAFLVETIKPNDTISSLWDRVGHDERIRTFDRFADALTLLYAGGLLVLDKGRLHLNRGEKQ